MNKNARIFGAVKLLTGVVLSIHVGADSGYAQESGAFADLSAQVSALGAAQPGNVETPKATAAADDTSAATVAVLFTGSKALKTSTTCEYGGREVTVPILSWENGINVAKDSSGQEIRQEYAYPIFASTNDIHLVGNYGLCYQVCYDACGNSICWPVCTLHCAAGGGGDPRPRPH